VTKAQFAAVMNGQTVSRTPHFALHRVALQPNSEPSSAPKAAANSQEMASQAGSQDLSKPLFAVQDTWLGVIVAKRWAKRAVTRNTIKRQIYAVSTASGCAPMWCACGRGLTVPNSSAPHPTSSKSLFVLSCSSCFQVPNREVQHELDAATTATILGARGQSLPFMPQPMAGFSLPV
jgi:ribonuclease P protein component